MGSFERVNITAGARVPKEKPDPIQRWGKGAEPRESSIGLGASIETEYDYAERRELNGQAALALHREKFLKHSCLLPILEALSDDDLKMLDGTLNYKGASFAEMAYFEEDHGDRVDGLIGLIRDFSGMPSESATDKAAKGEVAKKIVKIIG